MAMIRRAGSIPRTRSCGSIANCFRTCRRGTSRSRMAPCQYLAFFAFAMSRSVNTSRPPLHRCPPFWNAGLPSTAACAVARLRSLPPPRRITVWAGFTRSWTATDALPVCQHTPGTAVARSHEWPLVAAARIRTQRGGVPRAPACCGRASPWRARRSRQPDALRPHRLGRLHTGSVHRPSGVHGPTNGRAGDARPDCCGPGLRGICRQTQESARNLWRRFTTYSRHRLSSRGRSSRR